MNKQNDILGFDPTQFQQDGIDAIQAFPIIWGLDIKNDKGRKIYSQEFSMFSGWIYEDEFGNIKKLNYIDEIAGLSPKDFAFCVDKMGFDKTEAAIFEMILSCENIIEIIRRFDEFNDEENIYKFFTKYVKISIRNWK